MVCPKTVKSADTLSTLRPVTQTALTEVKSASVKEMGCVVAVGSISRNAPNMISAKKTAHEYDGRIVINLVNVPDQDQQSQNKVKDEARFQDGPYSAEDCKDRLPDVGERHEGGKAKKQSEYPGIGAGNVASGGGPEITEFNDIECKHHYCYNHQAVHFGSLQAIVDVVAKVKNQESQDEEIEEPKQEP